MISGYVMCVGRRVDGRSSLARMHGVDFTLRAALRQALRRALRREGRKGWGPTQSVVVSTVHSPSSVDLAGTRKLVIS